MTTATKTSYTVHVEENHWNAKGYSRTFDSLRKAQAFARQIQQKWVDREATGSITVSGRDYSRSYSVSH